MRRALDALPRATYLGLVATKKRKRRRNPTRAELTGEMAAPESVRIRNPYRDLDTVSSPAQLLAIWAAARRGEVDDLFVLGRHVLQRDLHIRSVYQTRKMAVERVPVHVLPASKSPADAKVAESVREFVVETSQFRQLRKDLSGAIYQGYEVAEVVWNTDNPSRWVPTYKWRWPHFFAWDRPTGTELRLRTSNEPLWGEEVPDQKFIVHKSTATTGHVFGRGLVFPLSSYHLFKSADVRAWITLGEKHGIPWRVVHSDHQPTEQDRENFFEAMQDLGSDAAVLLPPGMKLELSDGLSAKGSADFHERFFRVMNQEISKGYLGQTMTTEDGSSLAQAKVHDEVREDIRDADIADLDETIRESVVAWYVEYNFGPDVPLPMIVGSEKKPEDIAAVANALKAVSEAANRTIPVGWLAVLDKLGLPPPEEGEVLLDGQVMGKNGPEPDPNGEEPEPAPKGDGDQDDDEKDAAE